MLIGPQRRPPTDSARVAEIRAWVSEVISPAPGTTILVTELVCAEPGCPPVETAIGILAEGRSSVVTVHRPIAEVRHADVLAAFGGHDQGAQAARMVIMPDCVIDGLEGADDR
jgi:hypothetical protein